MDFLNLLITGIKLFSNGILALVFNPLVWFALIIGYSQYMKSIGIQKAMYDNRVKYPIKDLFATSVLCGILSGFALTVAMTVIGVTFSSNSGIEYIILLSLILMAIDPRYASPAYSGGILSIIVLILDDLIKSGIIYKDNVIVKIMQNNLSFDVSALMLLVALIHMIQSLLIWIDGHRGALPVFMKRNGKVVGAFLLQRIWIIPLMIFVLYKGTITGDTTPTPDWWPLIKPAMSRDLLKNAVFIIAPLAMIIGYNDFAVTTTPRKKVKHTSYKQFIFSLVLFIISLMSYKYYTFKYLAALFAPIGYELIIAISRYMDSTKKPLLMHSKEGVIVFDTIPDTPSEKMGLSPGDVILKVNNISVTSIENIEEVLKKCGNYIWVEFKNLNGEVKTLEYGDFSTQITRLGIITIPSSDNGTLQLVKNDGLLKKISKR